jgi:phosphatidylserine/phosphatidylglycerophosphate/cardiolipin synthase-like enzyme
MTLSEFAQYRKKSERNGTEYKFPHNEKKYDIIVVDECRLLGSNTELTTIIKQLIQMKLNPNGYIIIKSYFDPKLENDLKRKNKETKKKEIIFHSKVKLMDQRVITYDTFDNISMISIYQNK